jgi:hypothetical protein
VAAVRELVQVTRRLPLDAAALRVALLFLALDTLNESRRWTLGPLGAIEVDPHFTPVPIDVDDGRASSSTHGRLCAPDGYTVDIEVLLTTREGTDPRLSLRADPGSRAYRDELMVAAKAGLAELAEELRFFGSRQQAA